MLCLSWLTLKLFLNLETSYFERLFCGIFQNLPITATIDQITVHHKNVTM